MDTDTRETKAEAHCRWAWFAASIVLLAGAGLIYCWVAPREAVYQGKTSAEWFAELQKAYARHQVPYNGPYAPPRAMVLDREALLRDPATDGLRALGTNAALYLGSQIARENTFLARHYRKFYPKLPATVRRFLRLRPLSVWAFQRDAIDVALEALGQYARPAVPALIGWLRDTDGFFVSSAIRTLQKVPFDHQSLSPTLEELSRRGEHTNVVRIIFELGVRSDTAVRCLARALAAGGPTLRQSCLRELELSGTNAALALPQVTAALSDSDENIRYAAARALEAMGGGAGPAIPALMRATNDASIPVQRASARALRKIQGGGS